MCPEGWQQDRHGCCFCLYFYLPYSLSSTVSLSLMPLSIWRLIKRFPSQSPPHPVCEQPHALIYVFFCFVFVCLSGSVCISMWVAHSWMSLSVLPAYLCVLMYTCECVCTVCVVLFAQLSVCLIIFVLKHLCLGWVCVSMHAMYIMCVFCVWLSFSGVCFLQDKPCSRKSCATVARTVVGGGGVLGWDVESECLLFAIIVVIMASTGFSGVCSRQSYHYAVVLQLSIYCTDSSQEFPLLSCCWRFPLFHSLQFLPLSSLFFSLLCFALSVWM